MLWWLRAPGVFTIDEPNHIAQVVALQHGQWTLPGLDVLPASKELAFYEPNFQAAAQAPPRNDVPPLYGLIALPFSHLGFDALFYLNGAAFLIACALVFLFTRKLSEGRLAPWLALFAFALGGSTFEYALGLWPHMLSIALCTGCFVAAHHGRERDRLWAIAAAGMLGGIAIGVRYPNVVYAGSVGLAIVLWARRRTEATLTYALAAGAPVTLIAVLNDVRSGAANPISKGGGYLNPSRAESGGIDIADILGTFWFRVVDFASRPSGDFVGYSLDPDPETGAFLWFDVVKKSWLQSSPWVAMVLLAVTAAWLLRGQAEQPARRTLQGLGLTIWGVVAAFSVAGSGRPDGTCFNQRYLLDVMPLAAIALGLVVDRASLRGRWLALGGAVGGGLVYVTVVSLEREHQHRAILYLPLALAAALALTYMLRRWQGRLQSAIAVLLGASLAWGAGIHLGTDLQASRNRRLQVVELQAHLVGKLPPHSAVLLWGQYRSLAVPLLFEQDLIIVDVARDQGRDAANVTRALQVRGRRVYLLLLGLPPTLRVHLANTFGVAGMIRGGAPLLELANKR